MTCPFCDWPRGHATDCEWSALCQRVARIDALVNLQHAPECSKAGDTVAYCPECSPVRAKETHGSS